MNAHHELSKRQYAQLPDTPNINNDLTRHHYPLNIPACQQPQALPPRCGWITAERQLLTVTPTELAAKLVCL